jgi:hypothetical protein
MKSMFVAIVLVLCFVTVGVCQQNFPSQPVPQWLQKRVPPSPPLTSSAPPQQRFIYKRIQKVRTPPPVFYYCPPPPPQMQDDLPPCLRLCLMPFECLSRLLGGS